MMEHEVTVKIENGHHVCDPTETIVKPGDTVIWSVESKASIRFRETPFEEGHGPFPRGSVSKVKEKKEFSFKGKKSFEAENVKGQIIVDNS